MALNAPPIREAIQGQGGNMPSVWVKWFTNVGRILSGKDPLQLLASTVAAVPNPALFTGCVIYVSNESGGAVLAFSDGTNWRRVTDRAIIS